MAAPHSAATSFPGDHVVEVGRTSTSALLEALNDGARPVEEKVRVLDELLLLDQQVAANYVVDQLCQDALSAPWRNSLILIAERLQVTESNVRERLAEKLFDLAQTLRHSTEVGVAPVVDSAIRNFASTMDATKASSLIVLLEPPGPIETRLVTLLCVINLFENHPAESNQLQALRDRVHELALKFLDRDWLLPGEKAAIGQNAMVALAAMGDARVAACTEVVMGLAMPWLTRQLTSKLDVLFRTWSADRSLAQRPAMSILQEQLQALRTSA
ncbi:MAG: hypothetical protein ACREHD_02915 [Pirellulales bacterium]